MKNHDTGYVILGLGIISVNVTFLLAWLHSFIYCIQSNSIGLLIVDVLIFPVGIIHGIGLWVGIFH